MIEDDVVIVGAGPAGSVAATLLARAGARVRLIDRAEFPRDKLCGDTVNPGTLAVLRRLGMADAIDAKGLPIAGMLVTGHGVEIEGRYPDGLVGRSLMRRDLDWGLVGLAIAAGARFEPRTAVRGVRVDASGPVVSGVVVAGNGADREIRSPVVIAADGRRSTIAFGLGLARHPARPRRWAVGAYFEDVSGPARDLPLGEMHIRRGRYIGVAPLPGGVTNVCLVRPSQPADRAFGDPGALLRSELALDPILAGRFAAARLVAPPAVLGPLAVDLAGPPMRGLLLAGDAAGFVDPMTGDGLRFAVRGGEMAAAAACRALEHGWDDVQAGLTIERRREFGGKWRFNRALRAMVGSPAAVRLGGVVLSAAPGIGRAIVRRAGDCG